MAPKENILGGREMRITGSTYDFTWSNVDNAPDKVGVYVLYQHRNLIYIGCAAGQGETLRSRLQAHKRGNLERSRSHSIRDRSR